MDGFIQCHWICILHRIKKSSHFNYTCNSEMALFSVAKWAYKADRAAVECVGFPLWITIYVFRLSTFLPSLAVLLFSLSLLCLENLTTLRSETPQILTFSSLKFLTLDGNVLGSSPWSRKNKFNFVSNVELDKIFFNVCNYLTFGFTKFKNWPFFLFSDMTKIFFLNITHRDHKN